MISARKVQRRDKYRYVEVRYSVSYGKCKCKRKRNAGIKLSSHASHTRRRFSMLALCTVHLSIWPVSYFEVLLFLRRSFIGCCSIFSIPLRCSSLMPERFWSLLFRVRIEHIATTSIPFIARIPLLMSDVNVDVDVDVNRVFGGKSTHRSHSSFRAPKDQRHLAQ